MCAIAARLAASVAPIATNALIAAVPTLCPTIIAQACTKVSEPACSATSVVAAAALELCMTIDIRIPRFSQFKTRNDCGQIGLGLIERCFGLFDGHAEIAWIDRHNDVGRFDRHTVVDLLGEDAGLAEIHKLYRCHDRLLTTARG